MQEIGIFNTEKERFSYVDFYKELYKNKPFSRRDYASQGIAKGYLHFLTSSDYMVFMVLDFLRADSFLQSKHNGRGFRLVLTGNHTRQEDIYHSMYLLSVYKGYLIDWLFFLSSTLHINEDAYTEQQDMSFYPPCNSIFYKTSQEFYIWAENKKHGLPSRLWDKFFSLFWEEVDFAFKKKVSI